MKKNFNCLAALYGPALCSLLLSYSCFTHVKNKQAKEQKPSLIKLSILLTLRYSDLGHPSMETVAAVQASIS